MGVSPFFANKGYHLEISRDMQAVPTSNEAKQFVANLTELQEELKNNIATSQERYQKSADHNRAEAPDLKMGNQVYVKVKYFHCRRDNSLLQNLPAEGIFDLWILEEKRGIISHNEGLVSTIKMMVHLYSCLYWGMRSRSCQVFCLHIFTPSVLQVMG